MHGKIGESPSAPFAELFDSLTKSHCRDCDCPLVIVPILRYSRSLRYRYSGTPGSDCIREGAVGWREPRRMQSPSPWKLSGIVVAFHIVPIPRGDACDFCTARRFSVCIVALISLSTVAPSSPETQLTGFGQLAGSAPNWWTQAGGQI